MKNMPMQAVNHAQFPIGVEYLKTPIPTSTMKILTCYISFHFCIYSLLYFVPFFFFFHAFKLSKKKLINNVPKPANKNVIKNRIHILLSFNK